MQVHSPHRLTDLRRHGVVGPSYIAPRRNKAPDLFQYAAAKETTRPSNSAGRGEYEFQESRWIFSLFETSERICTQRHTYRGNGWEEAGGKP